MDQMMLTKEGKKELGKIVSASSKLQGEDSAGFESDVVHAGCTANVVMITKAEILCSNAGDSRSVLSKKGKAKDLSIDHKPDTPKEKQRIERANGFVEDNRVNGMLALSRSMGDFEYKNNHIMKPEDQIITAFPDITIEKITNDMDFIICACDGIWDCMSSQEAVTWVQEKMKKKKGKDSLVQVVEELFDTIIATDVAASGGIGCDNMSCIVIELKK